MAKIDFITQLQALGYDVQEPRPDFISFTYVIPVGRFEGKQVEIAFQMDNSYPINCPGGPHFKPLLLPITGGGGCHPYGAIHTSALGNDWEYWSRPFKDWGRSDKTAKTYLAHIKNLLATIPNE